MDMAGQVLINMLECSIVFSDQNLALQVAKAQA
jgi:hypothetical protein